MENDFLLIRKMKQGDENAFDLFVRKYYGDILKYCAYHCSDKKYAEDLAQETFLHFFAKLSDYRYTGKTKNYLYTIAGNLCRNYYKKAKEIPAEEELSGMEELTAQGVEGEVTDKVMLEWALNQLSSEFYDVITLFYFQEMKLKEIADTLQIGLPLVKYRLRMAKLQLQELIGKEETGYES
ncbi:RNA polymerase sigma factor [Faecalicatena sp. AGMB00832]|uniref:RNA polymerase sigma factor n=1 Tax=Faecalicatena faecalis TaxID=2726362 RepID=A0ABS6D4I6_9FIRM|nr:RNA polymerase sigma factor [Faecalicatena faecalis]